MHVPCPHCGSSDAGWRFEDGGFYCYACKHADQSEKRGEVESLQDAKPIVESAGGSGRHKSRLLKVEIKALGKRGITEDTAAKWRYGYASFNGQRVQVAQYFDAAGSVVAQKLRFPNKDFVVLGDLSLAGLYGQHLWRDGGRMVVVTEGEIDALSMSQALDNKWPVVSVPNGAGGAKGAVLKSIEWLERFDRVIFMLDMDEPGREAATACAQVLTPGKGYIAQLPLKDANEMLKAGRTKELLDAMWGAKVYRPDGLVAGEAVWERISRAEFTRTIPLPHSGLMQKLRGIRLGEVTVVVAGTGSGKSTAVREFAEFAIEAGEKVGYVGLEESVRRSALGLLSIKLNKPLHLLESVSGLPEVQAAWKEIEPRVVFYEHFGSLEDDNLISRIRYLMKAEGCSLVVLDHLSIVVSGMEEENDERKTIDRVMTRLASLAQETNCAILVVSHLSRREGKPHEQGRPVTLSDLRGSHSIGQLAHNVVSLERNQQAEDESERNTTTVRVLKCRHTGDTGVCGTLSYNTETGRLTEHVPEFASAGVAADVEEEV